jgi:predicted chitinase
MGDVKEVERQAEGPNTGMGDLKEAEKEAAGEEKDLITLDALKAGGDNLAHTEKLLGYLNKYAKLYEVNTKWRIAHFLAQVGHESSFKPVEENLSYSESRMKQIFGCKAGCWKDGDCPKDKRKREKLWDNPSNYSHNPANLANYVYADRLDNGDEASGDGYKYRGRGLVQLTGKANYKKYNEMHNEKNPDDKLDFMANPDLIVEQLEYAVESAFAWWNWNEINAKCMNGSDEEVKAVTLAVNGGTHGLDDRQARFNKIKAELTA